ncbi:MAG: sigma-70 family RNA polymerase sigma factor [Bacteroidota bacterium]
MDDEKLLIKQCIDGHSNAQELLYRRFASKMLGVCMRYANSRMEAEDILQEGFIKIFNNLDKFQFNGSLEGWVRRIMVNSALTHYKANIKYIQSIEYDSACCEEVSKSEILESINTKELLKLIQTMPEGYKMVFNMFAIEGYSHKEIGELMGISESTSKSQLSRARVYLQEKIKKLMAVSYERTA